VRARVRTRARGASAGVGRVSRGRTGRPIGDARSVGKPLLRRVVRQFFRVPTARRSERTAAAAAARSQSAVTARPTDRLSVTIAFGGVVVVVVVRDGVRHANFLIII